MGKLSGRIALVTGASRGIGRAAAKAFAAEGASVVAVARDSAALAALASSIAEQGGACRAMPLDVGDLPALERLADAIEADYGKLDILVGNAAVFPGHYLVHEAPLEAMQQTLHVNFVSNWYLLRCCDRLLRRSDAGRVIFVTAMGVYGGYPEWSAYASSKAALDRVMAAYAAENEAVGIRCNSLSPGPVLTDMGVQANKGDTEGMVPPEAIVPMFMYLVSAGLRETGRMFDYRRFADKQPLDPWNDLVAP